MRTLIRNILFSGIAILVFYSGSAYFLSHNDAASITSHLFSEYELPSWFLVVMFFIIMGNTTRIAYGRLLREKFGNLHYIGLLFLLTSCSEISEGCLWGSYPSPTNWPEHCEFFQNPRTANYTLKFYSYQVPMPPSLQATLLGDVNVFCKVIRERRLPHPEIQDSCYWSSEIVASTAGKTDANGYFSFDFTMEFGAVGDYFIVEGYSEKEGYNRSQFSKDGRYYFYEGDYIPGYELSVISFTRVMEIYPYHSPLNVSP